jgi:hypothetical protein
MCVYDIYIYIPNPNVISALSPHPKISGRMAVTVQVEEVEVPRKISGEVERSIIP